MSKHTDPTRIHNAQFVCHEVGREWIEYIQDDHVYHYGLKIKRPEGEERLGEPGFSFKLLDEEELVSGTDIQGGIFVVSSLKPFRLQQALAAGMQWLMQTGQLGCDDFWDRNGHEG